MSSVPALTIVYQRNGDGEAKSPACRAGVCEAVLHTLKQGTRFPAQVITEMSCGAKYICAFWGVLKCHIVVPLGFMGGILPMFMGDWTQVGSWQKRCTGKR